MNEEKNSEIKSDNKNNENNNGDDINSDNFENNNEFNAISSLNINKITNSIFKYYSTIGTNKKLYKNLDVLFYFIEIIINIISWAFLIILYGSFFIYGIGSSFSYQKIPNWVIKLNVLISKFCFGPLYIPSKENC
ncbi:hypothetical protein BCR36DRAFT_408176 [Piromyces finnis]|uniref:Uncharacterized protein n=1 Tax=Piromyces finnis TaxID=1754191 RepID=A0A1Y1VPZ9_9FUNG|nr:hypothetical protein BCR36DRAFT_408176 [Piromyces finnis]|eukprot:ORX61213.1 hypothetical protein BCR36DRAFT_408176 [Piromyces finnis]